MAKDEPTATPDRITVMDGLVREVLNLVRPMVPEPVNWLSEDACCSYCWDCAQMARAKEMGLCAPVREPPHKYYYLMDEKALARAEAYARFSDGIDGGYVGQSPTDNTQWCDTCGVLLAYSLTDEGAQEEIAAWMDAPVLPVGAGWHPSDSYALDRVHCSVSWGHPAWAVEGVISIAKAALSTTH